MSQPSINLANAFTTRIQELEGTRQKLEELFDAKVIALKELEFVYEGLYIDVFTQFESLIENLFIRLLIGEVVSSKNDVKPKAQFATYEIAYGILLRGDPYLDWLPYESKTLKKAEAFFENGLPFSRLSETEQGKLRRHSYIRNAIAHNSEHSQKLFRNKVINSMSVKPSEQTPSGYLRHIVSPPTVQYQIVLGELGSMALNLCE